MICLQSVPFHSMYSLNLQTSLKRIQESLIVPSQLADAGPEQTQGTERKVCVSSRAPRHVQQSWKSRKDLEGIGRGLSQAIIRAFVRRFMLCNINIITSSSETAVKMDTKLIIASAVILVFIVS